MIYDSNKLQISTYYNGEKVTPTYQITSDIATIDLNGLLTFSDYGEVLVTVTYNGESVTRKYIYSNIKIVNGYDLDPNGINRTNSNRSVVGPIKCSPLTDINWGTIDDKGGVSLCVYGLYGTTSILYNLNNNNTIKTFENASYLKASFVTNLLDNSYIYDATNSVYLWKGINVT